MNFDKEKVENALSVLNLKTEGTITLKEVSKNYKNLALKFHPDKNIGDETTEEKFKRITAAHDILTSVYETLNKKEFTMEEIKHRLDSDETLSDSTKISKSDYSSLKNKFGSIPKFDEFLSALSIIVNEYKLNIQATSKLGIPTNLNKESVKQLAFLLKQNSTNTKTDITQVLGDDFSNIIKQGVKNNATITNIYNQALTHIDNKTTFIPEVTLEGAEKALANVASRIEKHEFIIGAKGFRHFSKPSGVEISYTEKRGEFLSMTAKKIVPKSIAEVYNIFKNKNLNPLDKIEQINEKLNEKGSFSRRTDTKKFIAEIKEVLAEVQPPSSSFQP